MLNHNGDTWTVTATCRNHSVHVTMALAERSIVTRTAMIHSCFVVVIHRRMVDAIAIVCISGTMRKPRSAPKNILAATINMTT